MINRFGAVLAFLLASSVQAATVLDQSNILDPLYSPTAPAASNGSVRRIQTVTAGVSGILSEVDVEVNSSQYNYGTAFFSGLNIVATVNGVPTGAVLGTGTFIGIVDSFARFQTNLAINANDVFGIEAIGSAYLVAGSESSYAGGSDYVLNPPYHDSFTSTGVDDGFRTYVDVDSAVPEPMAWVMMIVGLGMVGCVSRRRMLPSRIA